MCLCYVQYRKNRLILVKLIFLFFVYKFIFYYVISVRYCFAKFHILIAKLLKTIMFHAIVMRAVPSTHTRTHIHTYIIQFYFYFTALIGTLYFKQQSFYSIFYIFFVIFYQIKDAEKKFNIV